MSKDEDALADMLKAAERVLSKTQGGDFEAFLGDEDLQDIVSYRLSVLGEAARRVSAGFRAAHQEVEWKSISGLGDILIHGYDIVSLKRVWEIVQVDLRDLVAKLEALVPKQKE